MLWKYGKGSSDAKRMQKKILFQQIFEEVALNYDCATQTQDFKVWGKDFQTKHVTHHALIYIHITANLGIIAANTASEESGIYQAIDFWLKSIWKCLHSIYNNPATFIHFSSLFSHNPWFLEGFQQLKKKYYRFI